MNRGLREYDSSTSTGELRLNLGDTNFVELQPPETDYVSFDYFSDATLDSFILSADENITRATGYAYRSLAGILTLSAVSIQTDDLRVSTIERAKLMRELARDWLTSADEEDLAAGSDLFEILPFVGLKNLHAKTWPEETARPYPV